MTDERALTFLRELERADEAAAAVLAELDELAAGGERLRARALELETFFARLPEERVRLRGLVADAATETARRNEALTRAEEEVAAAEASGDDDRVRKARRAEVRLKDALRAAERRFESRREEERTLEPSAADAKRERERLESRARDLARALRARPGLGAGLGEAPASGLSAVADWASGARAALLVARSRLAAEREAVIRQANELGAAVLGEPLGASSPSLVARRVEQAGESARHGS